MNQTLMWGNFVVLHQLALELTGNTEHSAYSEYSSSLNEDIFFEQCLGKNLKSRCRLIARKRKFVAFYSGEMDRAREMLELDRNFASMDTGGRMISAIISILIDGLLGFYYARKRQDDEAKWLNVGLNSLKVSEL